MKRFLHLAETAYILGNISQRSVRRLVEFGALRGVKVGGSLKVTEESVAAYMRKQVEQYIFENGVGGEDFLSDRDNS